jgi:hypothetical protein
MFSICVPAFRRWELHHAVNVWQREEGQVVSVLPEFLISEALNALQDPFASCIFPIALI